MSDNQIPQSDKKPQYQPGEGIRSMRSTTLFRAVNFELYAKPVSNAIILFHKQNYIETHISSLVRILSLWRLEQFALELHSVISLICGQNMKVKVI